MFSDSSRNNALSNGQPSSYMTSSVDDNSSSSFNSFFIPRLLRSSSIDEILNRPDAKLDDLLDDEDFSYDLKNGNPKLLDYFSKNTDNIRKLLDYILVMPPDPNEPKRSHKYPFVACEIFEADIAPIMNAFFFTHALKTSDHAFGEPGVRKKDPSEDYEVILAQDKVMTESQSIREQTKNIKPPQSLLEYLFSFVETDDELNPVLAGYVNKVVQALFKRNPRRMIEFMFEKEGLLMRLVQHIQEKSIAELIPMFICYEAFQTSEKPQSKLGIKNQVLDGILDALLKPGNEKFGEEESINAGYTLNEIFPKHNTIVDGKELLNHISSSKNLQKLFTGIKNNTEVTKVTSICTVISGLLQFYLPDPTELGPVDMGPGTGGDQEREKVIETLVENVETLQKILQGGSDEKDNNVETVFGTRVRIIGSARLKVIEIIQKMIALEEFDIAEKINELEILKIITDLFNESPWNNVLHTAYERLITVILDKSDPTLLKSLFEKAKFLDVIIEAGQNPNHELPKRGRKVRKGYMGHIIRMSNELIRYGNIEDNIDRYLKSNEQWSQFVNTTLRKQNEVNNTEIGGYNPRNFAPISNMESSFGNLALAEAQPTMPMSSNESFAAMPAEVETVEERTTVISPNKAGDIASAVVVSEFKDIEEVPKGSPSKAGDIAESNAFYEWKENKKAHLETLREEDKFPVPSDDVPMRKKPVMEAEFIQEEPAVIPVVEKNNVPEGEIETVKETIKIEPVVETEPESNLSYSPVKEKNVVVETDDSPDRKETTAFSEKNQADDELIQKILKSQPHHQIPRDHENQENLSPQKNINENSQTTQEQVNKVAGPIPENLREKNPQMDNMRKSVLGPKGAKMKLTIKKGEKGNANKIFEAITKHGNLRNSMVSFNSSDYTFTEASYSEPRTSDIESLSGIEEGNILSKLKEEENKESNEATGPQQGNGENKGNSPVKN